MKPWKYSCRDLMETRSITTMSCADDLCWYWRVGCLPCSGVSVAVNHRLLFLISQWMSWCFNIDLNFPLIKFSCDLGKFCFLLRDFYILLCYARELWGFLFGIILKHYKYLLINSWSYDLFISSQFWTFPHYYLQNQTEFLSPCDSVRVLKSDYVLNCFKYLFSY